MLRSPDAHALRALVEASEGSGELLKWLRLAALEKTTRPERIAALHQAAGATLALFAILDVMLAHAEAALPASVRERLASKRRGARQRNGRAVASHSRSSGRALRTTKRCRRPPRRLLVEFEAALRDFVEPRASEEAEPAAAAAEPGSFFAADAFTNPDHIRYALRTTGAALFCYLLYSILAWPGIHTCFITCYIVSLGTVAESVEKLALRILGCLVGAAAGIAAIVFLVPALTSIEHLSIVVFVASLLTGYVAAGSPRVSYAGFQAAFAFFLCVLQGNRSGLQHGDRARPHDRILLGNLVAYVALSWLWPVSVGRRIDPAIARLLARLGALSDAIGVGPAARSRRAARGRARRRRDRSRSHAL